MSAAQRAALKALDEQRAAQPALSARPALRADDLLESKWFGERGAVYVNRETGRRYRPHNIEERRFILADEPRRFLIKGGEGSGKSVAGIVKSLERLRRGMSGIMGSPDFVHFRKSLWREFQRWCPPNALIPKHRHRLQLDWAPQQPFELVFQDVGYGQGTLLCGGFDKPGSWEGPNVHFAHFDEARHHAGPQMAKVLDGRCRIAGPLINGHHIPPQWWITTTPRKSRLALSPEDMEHHWLFEMFGPWEKRDEVDPYAAFKANSEVITLRLLENAANLAEGYAEERRNSLREKEARILADAEWEDDDDTERFLPTMLWWDACEERLPTLQPNEKLIIALDAAIGRKSSASDCFGLVAVSRHPNRSGAVAIREALKWQAAAGQKIDFQGTERDPGPERVLRDLIQRFNVKCVVYDQYQLADMMGRVEKETRTWCEPFSQQGDRLVADKGLLDNITGKTVAHNGSHDLRQHIDNADRKVDESGSKFRLVQGRGKIDLAVCSSMGVAQCLYLNL